MIIAEICIIIGLILLGIAFWYFISTIHSEICDLEQEVETLEKALLDLINKENENE